MKQETRGFWKHHDFPKVTQISVAEPALEAGSCSFELCSATSAGPCGLLMQGVTGAEFWRRKFKKYVYLCWYQKSLPSSAAVWSNSTSSMLLFFLQQKETNKNCSRYIFFFCWRAGWRRFDISILSRTLVNWQERRCYLLVSKTNKCK